MPGVGDHAELAHVHQPHGLQAVGLYPVDEGRLVEAVQRPVERVHRDHCVVRHYFAPERQKAIMCFLSSLCFNILFKKGIASQTRHAPLYIIFPGFDLIACTLVQAKKTAAPPDMLRRVFLVCQTL